MYLECCWVNWSNTPSCFKRKRISRAQVGTLICGWFAHVTWRKRTWSWSMDFWERRSRSIKASRSSFGPVGVTWSALGAFFAPPTFSQQSSNCFLCCIRAQIPYTHSEEIATFGLYSSVKGIKAAQGHFYIDSEFYLYLSVLVEKTVSFESQLV